MIPKVIHYCWFGGGQKSELIEACIQSWRKWCPDWEIVEWNERKYSLQGTTQGNGLTGGVPPVRFSM